MEQAQAFAKLWTLIVWWTALLIMNVILLYTINAGTYSWGTSEFITMFLGMIGFAIGYLS